MRRGQLRQKGDAAAGCEPAALPLSRRLTTHLPSESEANRVALSPFLRVEARREGRAEKREGALPRCRRNTLLLGVEQLGPSDAASSTAEFSSAAPLLATNCDDRVMLAAREAAS